MSQADGLTREEVELNANNLRKILKGVADEDIVDAWLATDTALRQQVEALEKDNVFLHGEWTTLLGSFARLAADKTIADEKQASRRVVELQAQLAQVTQEREQLKDRCNEAAVECVLHCDELLKMRQALNEARQRATANNLRHEVEP
jgi:hypothetical protein